MSPLTSDQIRRLTEANNIWFATVRPNASPHLTPIWFVLSGEHIYICTSAHAVKVKNLKANPRAAVALEDGDDPLVIEGRAARIDSVPRAVVERFREKYDWDIELRDSNEVVVEFVPEKILMG